MTAPAPLRPPFAVPPPDPDTRASLDLCARLESARLEPAYREVFTKPYPLVSVCVATSNRGQLLTERCLASLMRQTYRRLEIVVVGDNCTDDTAARVASIGDSRIRFENLPVRGPYPPPGWNRWRVAGTNAMNRALAMVSGDFVTHLDDDDQMYEERIEILLDAIRSSRVDLVFHPFFCQAANGVWSRFGNGEFRLGQMTTGSIFYHRYFAQFGWNVYAYRTGDPGDWHRLRRLQAIGVTSAYVDRALIYHFKEASQPVFEPLPGETFLEDVEPPAEAQA
jgi:glycosyltransferase involved in cell wall biosynthesis